jgi:hypothetical protein
LIASSAKAAGRIAEATAARAGGRREVDRIWR